MSGSLISIFANQRGFVTVPGAPIIGTATSTGATTATVAYTAPSNGGSPITSYTATSSPGGLTGTLSQAGSGTITVTGLTASTSYTFTVKATNAIGQSAASAASNSITTDVLPGQQAYNSTGTYTFTVPTGVTSIATVVVGAGGGQYGPNGNFSGGGGGLAYVNNISVTPGESLTVYVGFSTQAYNCGSNQESSLKRGGTYLVRASGGTNGGVNNAGGASSTTQGAGGSPVTGTGGTGGAGGGNNSSIGAAGGAAGYAGNGGGGGSSGSNSAVGANGAGGGGGGGGPYFGAFATSGGGGVGLLGQGSDGTGQQFNACPNNKGSGGSNGAYNGPGGAAGGGTGGKCGNTGAGPNGGVRIIWPASTRSFPSTNTGNL